jgi:hypothetical protein
MVKKHGKRSTITYTKLPQISLKTSYQKIDKLKIKKKAQIKCFECSTLRHFSSEWPNKKSDQAKLSRRQRSLSQRRYFGCKEKNHNIAIWPKEEASKRVCQNWTVRFAKPEYPVSTENFRTSGQCNKGFKVALNKYMGKNESIKMQSKNEASRIKHQICYTCHDKDHLSKDYPKTQTFIHKLVKVNLSHVEFKNDTSITKIISSSCNSPHAI